MLNFEFAKSAPRPPELYEGSVVLRAPEFGDFAEWSSLREKSRNHLTRWEPDWRSEDVTPDAWRMRLRAYERQFRARTGVAFHICQASDNCIVGGVTLSDIRFHAACSATLGYWVAEDYLRRGFALAAVRAVSAYAFETLGLNRLEAACQPENLPSRGLLNRAGFREEGLAREFLFINGAWRDHALYALLAGEFSAAGRASDQ